MMEEKIIDNDLAFAPQVAKQHHQQNYHGNDCRIPIREQSVSVGDKDDASSSFSSMEPAEPASTITTPRRRLSFFEEGQRARDKHIPSSFFQCYDADCTTLGSPLILSAEANPPTKSIQRRPPSSSSLSSLSTTKEVQQPPAPRGVSFAMVEIREHPIIVGDHPGVKRGVPLSIGWESVDHVALHVDRYEAARSHHRRSVRSMRLVAEHREQLLRTLGFSREEMLWGQANAKLVRKLREKTNDRLSLDRFHEVWESIGRKFRNLVTLGKFKRRQKEYLQKHVPSCNDLEALTATTKCDDAMTKRQSFIGGSTISSNTWLGESNRRGSSSSILSVRSLQESLGYLSDDDYF